MRTFLLGLLLASAFFFAAALLEASVSSDCADELPNCNYYDPESCEYDQTFMQQNCAKYCDMC